MADSAWGCVESREGEVDGAVDGTIGHPGKHLETHCAVVFVLLILALSGPKAWRISVTQLTPPSALTSAMARV